MGTHQVVKMTKAKEGEIHAKTVLEGPQRGVRVGTEIQRERSPREREVELGQGQEIDTEVGQGTGGKIGVLVGKGRKDTEAAQGTEVGQGKKDVVEVGQGTGDKVKVGQGKGGAVGQGKGKERVEVGQEGGIVVGAVTNIKMIRRKNSVTQQTLRVVNLSRRNGKSHNQTAMMDAGASRRNRGRTGLGVDLVNPNPTKNLVAVRSPDTGLAPAQGGKTSSYLILSLFPQSV